jgi:hypothetical protein
MLNVVLSDLHEAKSSCQLNLASVSLTWFKTAYSKQSLYLLTTGYLMLILFEWFSVFVYD